MTLKIAVNYTFIRISFAGDTNIFYSNKCIIIAILYGVQMCAPWLVFFSKFSECSAKYISWKTQTRI